MKNQIMDVINGKISRAQAVLADYAYKNNLFKDKEICELRDILADLEEGTRALINDPDSNVWPQ